MRAGNARVSRRRFGDDGKAAADIFRLRCAPADFGGDFLQAFFETDARYRIADGVEIAFAQNIFHAQLERVHAQSLGDHIDLRFDRPGTFRHP
jgi:hypothetical protein